MSVGRGARGVGRKGEKVRDGKEHEEGDTKDNGGGGRTKSRKKNCRSDMVSIVRGVVVTKKQRMLHR